MSEPLFDKAAEYEEMLQRGLDLTGENWQYFAKERVRRLCELLPAGFAPDRVADFGCGLGGTAPLLAERFPGATVVGVDPSASAVELARATHGSDGMRFGTLSEFPALGPFGLCYVNGVFHHIAPSERLDALRQIWNALEPGGFLAFFENNPLNPGTRLVMRRVPFDRDAKTLRGIESRALLESAGFECPVPTRYLFVFPRVLRRLRFLERFLLRLPVGGQYLVLVRRPDEAWERQQNLDSP